MTSSNNRGRDSFVLAAGEGTDIIMDFEVGLDLLVLVGGLSTKQLSINQSNTLIDFGSETLAILNGVNANELMLSVLSPLPNGSCARRLGFMERVSVARGSKYKGYLYQLFTVFATQPYCLHRHSDGVKLHSCREAP